MEKSHIILQGDAWELAKTLPSGSVQMICTSPPYWSLRDYGTAQWEGGDPACQHRTGNQTGQSKVSMRSREKIYSAGARPGGDNSLCIRCGAKRVDAQFGLEATPQEYVEKLVVLFRELRRVLHDSGTVWLNLGDSYIGSGGAGDWSKRKAGKQEFVGPRGEANRLNGGHNLKPKNMAGIPWRVAFALQEDGWILRSDIIWHKPNPMPESVTDRPTKAHEYIFMFAKSERYYYDGDAVREPHLENSIKRFDYALQGTAPQANQPGGDVNRRIREKGLREPNPSGRNRRTVWTIPSQLFSGAHFATFPEALITPCILAGSSEVGNCPECGNPWRRIVERKAERTNPKEAAQRRRNAGVQGGGTEAVTLGVTSSVTRRTVGWEPTCKHGHDPVPAVVLDIFLGSGTTAAVAIRHGRHAVGFELNPDYMKLAEERISQVKLEMKIELPPLEKQMEDLPLFATMEENHA